MHKPASAATVATAAPAAGVKPGAVISGSLTCASDGRVELYCIFAGRSKRQYVCVMNGPAAKADTLLLLEAAL